MLQTTDPHIITTQIDSLHTQVQIIDTTVTHVHVYDTIVTHVYDTIPPDLIAVYDKLITTQDNNFDNILVAIGVTVTVLVILVTFSNILLSKKLIKHDFKKSFEKVKGEIENSLGQIKEDTHYMKGESSRLFAINAEECDENLNGFVWWSKALMHYSLANSEEKVNLCIEQVVISINNLSKKKNEFYEELQIHKYKIEILKEYLNFIPSYVRDKEDIERQIDELYEYSANKDKLAN